jgi:hypothetical protein
MTTQTTRDGCIEAFETPRDALGQKNNYTG